MSVRDVAHRDPSSRIEARPDSAPLFSAPAFGRAVRMHCADLNLSHREAAPLARVSHATLSRVCAGRSPDIETYFRLREWMRQREPHPSALYDATYDLAIDPELADWLRHLLRLLSDGALGHQDGTQPGNGMNQNPSGDGQ
jgi:hypothetical protein